jgi:hypothetical protein
MRHKSFAVQSPGFPGNLLWPETNYWQMASPDWGLGKRLAPER